MAKIEFILFHKGGKKLYLDLKILLIYLINQEQEITTIKYDGIVNTMYFECEKFDISFPKENNRFSINSSDSFAVEIIKKIEKIYHDEDLFISTPPHETFKSISSSREEIKKYLGISIA